MKTPRWIGLIVLLGMVAVALVIQLGQRLEQPPSLDAGQPGAAIRSSEEKVVPVLPALKQPVSLQPIRSTPAARSLEAVVPDVGGAPGDIVRVQPSQMLATVNGVAITLKDLMPLPLEKAEAEQAMSAERYGFLLNRAVERELTFQAAQNHGVEFTETQLKRLEDLGIQSEQVEPGVFDTVQHNPANVAFEKRDAAGLLLQATLAEKAGVPSPHVIAAQVEAYYQQHQSEYGALPVDPAQHQAAWDKIDQDVRLKLAPQIQAEHQEGLRQFLEQLKTTAQITTAPLL